jgi:hypothetical protein
MRQARIILEGNCDTSVQLVSASIHLAHNRSGSPLDSRLGRQANLRRSMEISVGTTGWEFRAQWIEHATPGTAARYHRFLPEPVEIAVR